MVSSLVQKDRAVNEEEEIAQSTHALSRFSLDEGSSAAGINRTHLDSDSDEDGAIFSQIASKRSSSRFRP